MDREYNAGYEIIKTEKVGSKNFMYDNCFAKNGNKCRVLTDMLCTKGKCPFYKSKQKYEADMKKYPPLKDIGGR